MHASTPELCGFFECPHGYCNNAAWNGHAQCVKGSGGWFMPNARNAWGTQQCQYAAPNRQSHGEAADNTCPPEATCHDGVHTRYAQIGPCPEGAAITGSADTGYSVQVNSA